MRIITGTARGTKLFSPEGEATRPTSDRAKEAIFSALQFSIEGRRILDLYAGSGQMALEALSRGAEFAVMVDHSPEAAAIIRKNAEKTRLNGRCRVDVAEVNDRLYHLRDGKFDIVFIDPPYALGLVPGALTRLLSRGLVRPTTYIVCETADENDVFGGDAALEEKFTVYKKASYGLAKVCILQPKEEYISERGEKQ